MDPLLTRRQTLQSFAFSAVFGGSVLSLVGCGGGGHHGGNGGGISTQTVRVPIELPSGFPLAAAELQAGTAFGTSAISSSSFGAKVNRDAPTFAFLRHKPTGKFILFGLVGSGRLGLTPLSTAAAAMALYFGWVRYPGPALAQALTLLEANGDVQALGQAIAEAIATDPYAVTNGNASVVAAMKTAIEALRPSGAPQIDRAAANAQSRAEAPLIQVQPFSEQSGGAVDQGEDGFVVPTNLWQRPISFYTYRVGHDPAVSTAVSRIDQQDLLPTGTFLGQIASLNERPAWAHVVGKPVELPITGNDEKTLYETIALMGTFEDAPTEPAFFNDPKYAGEVVEWRTKLDDLRVYSCFHSVGSDIFNAAALGGGSVLYYSAAKAIRAQITQIASDAAALVIAKAQGGKYGEYLMELMESISEEYYKFYTAGSTRWRSVGLQMVGLAEKEAEAAALGEAGSTIASIAFLTASILAAAGSLIGVIDVGMSASDTLSSPPGVQWTITSLKPKVRISPDEATIKAGADQSFSAALVGLGGSTGVTYRWSVTGSDLANLGDGKGKIGTSFDTDSNVVNLATTPSTQGPLIVTVEAFRNGESLGKDKATVNFGDGLIWQSGTYGVYTFPADYGNIGVVPYVAVGKVGKASGCAIRARGGVFGDTWSVIVSADTDANHPGEVIASMSPYDARGYFVENAVTLAYNYGNLQYLDHAVSPSEAEALSAKYGSTFGAIEYQWAATTA